MKCVADKSLSMVKTATSAALISMQWGGNAMYKIRVGTYPVSRVPQAAQIPNTFWQHLGYHSCIHVVFLLLSLDPVSHVLCDPTHWFIQHIKKSWWILNLVIRRGIKKKSYYMVQLMWEMNFGYKRVEWSREGPSSIHLPINSEWTARGRDHTY